MKLYLHQFLSRTGVFSSKALLLGSIRDGEISVSGRVVTNPMHSFDPSRRRVFLKGVLLRPVRKVYIIINKPQGCLSSRLTPNDARLGKKSIFGLIAKDRRLGESARHSLSCVGRLDEDSSGMLLLTNDGLFGSKVASPGSNVQKTYRAVLQRPVSDAEISMLEQGVVIGLEENGVVTKYRTKGCRISVPGSDRRQVDVTLTEGKKREVRRMFEAVGNKVLKLCRTSIGNLNLDSLSLKEGEYVFADRQMVERVL